MKKVKSLIALILAVLMVFGSSICAFAADVTETEDNGTAEKANAMTIGTSIKGKISDVKDADYFTFTATENGLVTVTLAHDVKTASDAASYFKVSIYDSNKALIYSFVSTGSDASVSVDFSVNAAAYYVAVEADRAVDDTLEYALSAKLSKTALFEKEPNNLSSQATAMELSKKGATKLYYGSITAGDVDYFEVNFDKPLLASFGIYNTTSQKGNYKASLVKVVDGLNGETSEKVVGTIEITDGVTIKDSPTFGINGGKYYLKVTGATATSTGSYQVRVYAGSSNSTDEYEYNNEEKYANLINVGKSMTANIFDKTDVDIFKFTATDGNSGYEIALADYESDKAVANGQWGVEILNENGNVVKEKVTVTNNENGLISTGALAKGTYYVKVTAGNVFTGETYKVTLAQKKASADDNAEKDDGKTTIDEFIEDMKAIDWSGFWKNFEGWFEYINVIGIVKDLMTSVMDFLTTFVFANK